MKPKKILDLIDESTIPDIKVGDKVRYTGKFLRSIGAYTGPLGQGKGIVKKLEPLGRGSDLTYIATIDWNNPEIPEKVNIKNLEKIK